MFTYHGTRERETKRTGRSAAQRCHTPVARMCAASAASCSEMQQTNGVVPAISLSLFLTHTHTWAEQRSRYSDWLWAGRSGDRIPVGGEIFRTCPDRPWGQPSLLYNGYRVFPGGKEWPRRDADPSPPSSAVVMKR